MRHLGSAFLALTLGAISLAPPKPRRREVDLVESEKLMRELQDAGIDPNEVVSCTGAEDFVIKGRLALGLYQTKLAMGDRVTDARRLLAEVEGLLRIAETKSKPSFGDPVHSDDLRGFFGADYASEPRNSRLLMHSGSALTRSLDRIVERGGMENLQRTAQEAMERMHQKVGDPYGIGATLLPTVKKLVGTIREAPAARDRKKPRDRKKQRAAKKAHASTTAKRGW